MGKRLSQIILICGLALSVSGCAAIIIGGAAGAGVLWYKGKMQYELNASLDDVYNATLKALRTLELPIEDRQKDAMSAKLKAAFADGKPVWIDILFISESTTKIIIRVGKFGDEVRSRKILDTVRENLPK